MPGRLKTHCAHISLYLLGYCSLCICTPIYALEPQHEIVKLDADTEINIEVYAQSSNSIFIWQSHEVGLQDNDRQLARALAQQGIETWLVDLLESNFLANTANNMDRITGKEVVALLDKAVQSGKPVIVAASGRGAIPMLRGVRLWQQAHQDNAQLVGVVLLSPKLYIETPAPGVEGKFMPIAAASNIPIVILQPDQSPWYWKLHASIAALQSGGSDVFYQPLRGVRDRFYFRPDANEHEIKLAHSLADKLATAANLLRRLPRASHRAVSQIAPAPAPREGKPERSLQTYQGNPEPPALRLPKLGGGQFDLQDLKGKVVLVNFWASWCPPCVHEMPSMQRLQDQLAGQPFTIIGVNMAEEPAVVRRFLTEQVNVNFPIVLDHDGLALKDWQVFAFPTSYLIDQQGKIRYALFGGVEWDTPEIIAKIHQLINVTENK